ncbi:hypothetical protein KSP39_PZI016014 [Platanthera zijinensis]|uniref:Uncharacterized protein n=1 Tax=Platanthera zijinensis TaxID=2320716 RepID=A0AAP0B8U9_9ASPA
MTLVTRALRWIVFVAYTRRDPLSGNWGPLLGSHSHCYPLPFSCRLLRILSGQGGHYSWGDLALLRQSVSLWSLKKSTDIDWVASLRHAVEQDTPPPPPFPDFLSTAHIGDGIKFIQNAYAQESSIANGDNGDHLKIILIDADSSDPSSGLACPPADFVEDHFLSLVKDFLSTRGLFVINLVSRSASIRQGIISRLKSVFDHLFSLELEEDVNVVLFAASTGTCCSEDQINKAAEQLQNLLKVPLPSMCTQAMSISRLK